MRAARAGAVNQNFYACSLPAADSEIGSIIIAARVRRADIAVEKNKDSGVRPLIQNPLLKALFYLTLGYVCLPDGRVRLQSLAFGIDDDFVAGHFADLKLNVERMRDLTATLKSSMRFVESPPLLPHPVNGGAKFGNT